MNTNLLEGVTLPSVKKYDLSNLEYELPRPPKVHQYYGFDKYYKYGDGVDTGLFNYDDPYEINSMADVVLTTFNDKMKRPDYGRYSGILNAPIINWFSGAAKLGYDTLIDPYVKAFTNNPDTNFFKKLGYGAGNVTLNTLTSLTETLDVIANPVKAYLMDESIKDAMGFGSAGRKNFDWDTGNIITDIGLELISDPINWMTLFGKGMIVQGVKRGVGATIAQVAKQSGDKATREFTTRYSNRMARKALHSYLQGDTKSMVNALEHVTKIMAKKEGWIFQKELLPQDYYKIMFQVAELSKERMGMKVMEGLSKIVRPTAALERSLIFGGLVGGAYPLIKGIHKVKDWRTHYLQGRHVGIEKDYLTFDGTLDILRADELEDVTRARSDVDKVLMNDTAYAPEIRAAKLRQTVSKDLEMFKEIRSEFYKEMHSVKRFKRIVDKYFETKYGTKSFQEFLTKLEQLNVKMKNGLGDVVRTYRKIYDAFSEEGLHEMVVNRSLKSLDVVTGAFKKRISDIRGLKKGDKVNLKRNETIEGFEYEIEQVLKNPTSRYEKVLEFLTKKAVDRWFGIDPRLTSVVNKDMLSEYSNVLKELEKAKQDIVEYILKNRDISKISESLLEVKQLDEALSVFEKKINNSKEMLGNRPEKKIDDALESVFSSAEKTVSFFNKLIELRGKKIKFKNKNFNGDYTLFRNSSFYENMLKIQEEIGRLMGIDWQAGFDMTKASLRSGLQKTDEIAKRAEDIVDSEVRAYQKQMETYQFIKNETKREYTTQLYDTQAVYKTELKKLEDVYDNGRREIVSGLKVLKKKEDDFLSFEKKSAIVENIRKRFEEMQESSKSQKKKELQQYNDLFEIMSEMEELEAIKVGKEFFTEQAHLSADLKRWEQRYTDFEKLVKDKVKNLGKLKLSGKGAKKDFKGVNDVLETFEELENLKGLIRVKKDRIYEKHIEKVRRGIEVINDRKYSKKDYEKHRTITKHVKEIKDNYYDSLATIRSVLSGYRQVRTNDLNLRYKNDSNILNYMIKSNKKILSLKNLPSNPEVEMYDEALEAIARRLPKGTFTEYELKNNLKSLKKTFDENINTFKKWIEELTVSESKDEVIEEMYSAVKSNNIKFQKELDTYLKSRLKIKKEIKKSIESNNTGFNNDAFKNSLERLKKFSENLEAPKEVEIKKGLDAVKRTKEFLIFQEDLKILKSMVPQLLYTDIVEYNAKQMNDFKEALKSTIDNLGEIEILEHPVLIDYFIGIRKVLGDLMAKTDQHNVPVYHDVTDLFEKYVDQYNNSLFEYNKKVVNKAFDDFYSLNFEEYVVSLHDEILIKVNQKRPSYMRFTSFEDIPEELVEEVLPQYIPAFVEKYEKLYNKLSKVVNHDLWKSAVRNGEHNYPEELQEVQRLLNSTDAIPYNYKKSLFYEEVQSDLVTFKTEAIAYHISMLRDESIKDIMFQIGTGSGAFGKVFSRLLDARVGKDVEGFNALTQSIKDGATNFMQYHDFINDTMQLDVDEIVKSALLSTIQHPANANASVNRIIANFDGFINDVIDSANRFMYSAKMKHPLSLQYFRETDDDVIKLMENLSAHTGSADIQVNELVFKKHLPELIESNTNYIIMDLETTGGSNLSKQNILNIAFKKMNDSKIHDYRMVLSEDEIGEVIPSDKILNVFFPDTELAYASKGQRIEAFKEMYQGKLDTSPESMVLQNEMLSTQFPDLIGVDMAEKIKRFNETYGSASYTEALSLYKFSKYLEGFRDQAPYLVRIVGHNISNFDIPVLKARMFNYGFSTNDLDKIPKIDTFEELKKKKGIKQISGVDKNKIKVHIQAHLNELQSNHTEYLLKPIKKDFIDDVKRFIDLFGSKKTPLTLADNLEIPENFTDTLSKVVSKMRQAGKNISNDNKVLAEKVLDKDFFKSQDGVNYFIDYLKNNLTKTAFKKKIKELGLSAVGDGVYQGSLNINKIIGAINDTHFLSTIGYKNTIDLRGIREWLRTDADEFLSTQDGFRMNKIRRVLEGKQDSIVNTSMLKQYRPQLEKLASLYKELVKEFNDPLLEALDFETINLKQKYAMLSLVHETALKQTDVHQKPLMKLDGTKESYLYNKKMKDNIAFERKSIAEKYKEYLNTFFEGDESFIAFMNDPSHLYGRSIDYKLDLHTELAVSAEFDRISKEFAATQADFEVLGQMNEANKLVASKSIMYGKAMQPVIKMFDELKKITADKGKSKFLNRAIQKHMDAYSRDIVRQLVQLSPQDMLRHMVYNAEFMTFDYRTFLTKGGIEEGLNTLLQNKKLYEEVGIKIHQKGTRIYLSLDLVNNRRVFNDMIDVNKKYTWNGEIVEPLKLKDIDFKRLTDEMHTAYPDGSMNEFTKALKETHDSINFLSRSSSAGSLGDIVRFNEYDRLIESLPKEIKDSLGDLKDVKHQTFKNKVRYNFMNLGLAQDRRAFMKYSSNNLISMYANSIQSAVRHARSAEQYTMLYFNDANSINVGALGKMSDQALFDSFKQNEEYVLAALVPDKKRGYKVKKIPLLGPNSIKEARALNAQILPYQAYATSFSVINNQEWSSLSARMWQGLTYLYKVGWLAQPGSWLRNYVDSSLKTIIDTGRNPMTVLGEQVKNIIQLRKYNEVIKSTIKLNKKLSQADKDRQIAQVTARYKAAVKDFENSPQVKAVQLQVGVLYQKYLEDVSNIEKIETYESFTKEAFEEYYRRAGTSPALDRETFELIHRHVVDGPGVGFAGTAFDKMYHTANIGKMTKWNRVQKYLNLPLQPHQYIEQINRLTHYMILHEAGVGTSKAWKRIADTHFDYKIMTDTQRRMEMIFPFYTFYMKNIDYWMRVARDNPLAIGILEDVMTPIYDFDSYDHYELKFNQSLQYQITSGNVPLPFDMTLKLNPSFMDVINIATDPIGNIQQRANPMIKVGTQVVLNGMLSDPVMNAAPDYMSTFLSGLIEIGFDSDPDLSRYLFDNIPILGSVYNRYGDMAKKYQERSGQWIHRLFPDIFGATNRWDLKHGVGYNYKPYPKRKRSGGGGRKNYSYDNRPYTPKEYSKKEYYSQRFKNYYMRKSYHRTYYPQQVQYESFYKSHYTKSGASRMKMKMAPLTAYNLQYRIKDIYY